MKGLTSKQKNILDFIEEFMTSVGMAPTVYEIAEHFKIKTSTVFAHIRALQRKDFLTRSSKARSISLTRPKHRSRRPTGLRSVPVIEDAASADKKMREFFCDASLVGSGPVSDVRNLFAIRVKGASLQSCGILDGDIAILRKHPASIKSGDIVLADFDGSPSLRTCAKVSGDKAELVSGDPSHKPTVCRIEDIPLHGVVVSVQRAL